MTDQIIPSNPKKFIREQSIATEYKVFLDNEVKSSEEYTELFNILIDAGVNDEINIYINNDGGLIDTAIELINLINDSDATITTILTGSGHSAASLIFMAGDKKIVKKHSYMLCHFYSGWIGGKGNEIIASSKFHDKHLKKWFADIYKDLLTKKELTQMFAGTDIWLSDEDIKKRLKLK